MSRDIAFMSVEAEPGQVEEILYLSKDIARQYGWPERQSLSREEARVAVQTNLRYRVEQRFKQMEERSSEVNKD